MNELMTKWNDKTRLSNSKKQSQLGNKRKEKKTQYGVSMPGILFRKRSVVGSYPKFTGIMVGELREMRKTRIEYVGYRLLDMRRSTR